MQAPTEETKFSSYNLAAMSFTPTEIEITKHILNLRLPMNLTFVKK
jgi:hypothetical protein